MADTGSASAPKKLKLTLKLNSSSSSSSSPVSTPATSQLNSSVQASPVKASEEINSTPVTVVPLSDLPSGLGNLKGRGRPKKPGAVKTTDSTNKDAGTNSTINTQSSNTTAAIPTANEYAADLKSFVSSMNTFKCRSWSLNRPISLDTKNVAGYSVDLSCGLWCTVASELGSAHLRSAETQTPSATVATAANNSKEVEITCQCGKVFNVQSKYKKHLKTHEKPIVNVNGTVTQTPATPTISLKIKLNTHNNNNNNQ